MLDWFKLNIGISDKTWLRGDFTPTPQGYVSRDGRVLVPASMVKDIKIVVDSEV